MRVKLTVLLLTLGFVLSTLVLFASSGEAESQAEKNSHYRLVYVSCWFDADWRADIACGELHTPDNHGQFTLPVVVIRADVADKRPDPVVYLQGGPGASARLHTDGIKRWLNWMRLTRLKRDLILIDTRGTGRSKPALVCADYNRANQQSLLENKTLGEELAQSFAIIQHCFQNARARNIALDHRHFGTQLSAKDIRALMDQLNYREWNIIGVSYGTRLALEIARQEQVEPQNVRLKSMVLDSIYPAGFGGVQTWPQVLDDAVQHFLRACAEQLACGKESDLTQTELTRLLISAFEQLQQEPMRLTVRHRDGEAPIQWLVNDHRFLSLIFSGIYDPADWPKIMEAIKGVNAGRSEMLKPLAEPYLNNSVSADFNSLTFTAVDCADNPVQPEVDYLASVARYPLLQAYTRDQWRYQACHELPGATPLQLTPPHVPTLILAGAKDPITPVSWAKEVHRQWPQTQLRVNENLAHSVLVSDLCVLENLVTFFDEPTLIFTACPPPASPAN